MEPDLGAMDDASEWLASPALVYRTDLENLIIGARDAGEALTRLNANRSLNMVLTKLEEAQLWLTQLDREGGEA